MRTTYVLLRTKRSVPKEIHFTHSVKRSFLIPKLVVNLYGTRPPEIHTLWFQVSAGANSIDVSKINIYRVPIFGSI